MNFFKITKIYKLFYGEKCLHSYLKHENLIQDFLFLIIATLKISQNLENFKIFLLLINIIYLTFKAKS